jgi:hypothetical protein
VQVPKCAASEDCALLRPTRCLAIEQYRHQFRVLIRVGQPESPCIESAEAQRAPDFQQVGGDDTGIFPQRALRERRGLGHRYELIQEFGKIFVHIVLFDGVCRGTQVKRLYCLGWFGDSVVIGR